MAALPYMPLYVADYLADAAHLSTLQHGAYLLLIMTYWQRGEPLPDNDARLARIARLTDREWRDNRDDLGEFFDIGNGVWCHGRVERELEKVRAKSDQARNAGKTSAQRRSNGRSTDDATPAQLPFNHTDTDTDTDTCVSKDTLPREISEKEKVEAVFEAWNVMAKASGLPTCSKLTDSRKTHIKARVKDHGHEAIVEAFAGIPASSFLMGRNDRRDGRKWRANLDDILRPDNTAKLIDGGYHAEGEERTATPVKSVEERIAWFDASAAAMRKVGQIDTAVKFEATAREMRAQLETANEDD